MYKLRQAVSEDFAALASIHDDPANTHLANKQEKLDKEFIEQVLQSETGRIYVVEKSGRIVGFIVFDIKLNLGMLDIDLFSIHQTYEKKGIDEHLFQKVKRLAERQGIKQMKATLTTANPIVQTFFEEKGWQSDGTETGKKLIIR